MHKCRIPYFLLTKRTRALEGDTDGQILLEIGTQGDLVWFWHYIDVVEGDIELRL